MSAAPTDDSQHTPVSDANKQAQPHTSSTQQSNPPDEKEHKKDSSSSSSNKNEDNDKNIHVPKDKKLKIERVSVDRAFVNGDAVFYDISVKTARNQWHVTKRYSQFEDLNHQLAQFCKDKLPVIPAKHYKWFTDHTKSSFIEKRRALLDNYVRKLIRAKNVSSSQSVVNFFHEDRSQPTLINGNASHKADSSSANTSQKNESEHTNPNKESSSRAARASDDWDFPEDQEVTNIVIQSTRKMSDHVLYQICVSNSLKRASFRSWTVLKRFTQFYEMDSKLRADLEVNATDLLAELPPVPGRKLKFVVDHMDEDFIEKRRVLLQNYLSKLLRYPRVVQNEDFLEFLGVDV